MPNTQLQPLQFVKNKFGRDSLILGGYRYRVRSSRASSIYWICSDTPCAATVTTCDGRVTNYGNRQHQHPANQPNIDAMKVFEIMKERSKDEVTPIPTIFSEEAIKLRTPEWNQDTIRTIESLPTYHGAKTILYRHRSRSRPPLPKTVYDLDLQGEWCLTTAADQFLIPDDDILPSITTFTTISAPSTTNCDDWRIDCSRETWRWWTMPMQHPDFFIWIRLLIFISSELMNYIKCY